MSLVLAPDDRLTTPCFEVTEPSFGLFDQVEAMMDLMHKHGGIGLAANQAEYHNRVIVMQLPGEPRRVMINPKLWQISGERKVVPEGCLSFPGQLRAISRLTEVRVWYRNTVWQEHTVVLKGLGAQCAQHEIEHLAGEVFTDKGKLYGPSDPRSMDVQRP